MKKQLLLLTLLLTISTLTAFAQTPAPSGFSEQRFCNNEYPKVSDISVTGSNIKWYNAVTGGNLIPLTNDLISGQDYFATQTISGIESTSRLKVHIIKEMQPFIFTQGTTFCGSAELSSFNQIYPSNSSEMMYSSNIQWSKDGQSIMNVYNNKYTADQSGNYNVTLTSFFKNSTNGIIKMCVSQSSQIQITVNPNPTATITPVGSTTISTGGSVVLNANTGTGYTYEWFKDGTSITGATTSSYTATQSGSYTVKVSNSSTTCNATSTPTVVSVNSTTTPTATITIQGATTFCQGGSVVLNANTGTGYTYEWFKNGTIINGSTTISYTATQSGNYTVKVINGSANTTSVATVVTVNPNPTATIIAGDPTTFCQGGSVILNASTGTGYTYVWYKNGTIINGATTSSYTANQSGSYTVKVINGTCNATSTATTVIVNPNPTVSLNALNNVVYKTSSAIQLVGNPSGGIYSGETVSGNIFTPANATLGKKTVSYKYTTQGCSGSATQTTIVADTVGNVCSTYDTLKIKVHFTAGLYVNTSNTIKFYPNPTKDILFIDNGNYQAMNGYSIKIVSLTGTVVYNQTITSQQVQISMNQFGAKGLYIAQIIDPNNSILDSKKIVLE